LKLSRPTNPSLPQAAGFTLVEALAALTVMAIAMTAIGALANSSMRSSLYVERHLAEIETARKIIAGMPSRKDLTVGSLTGILDNHQWRIDSTPFPNALVQPGAPIVWEPQRLALRVLSPSGAIVEIDTVRLKRRAAQ
jgi:general secretion pathway protein I